MCQKIRENELGNYKGENWIGEPKYDGSRIIYRYGEFFTQNRDTFKDSRDVSYKFPELKLDMNIPAVLDGEIVADSGSFEDTGSRIHLEDKLKIKISAKRNSCSYYIFDILEVNGTDVTHLSLEKRKELLKSLDLSENERYKLVEWTKDIDKLWQEIKDRKGEGIVLKDINSSYDKARRSWSWIKCKNWKEDIVICKSYDENPKGIALYMDNGQRLQCAGSQHYEVKQAIDELGSVRIEIQYLTKDKKVGGTDGEYVYRFPSFRGMVA